MARLLVHVEGETEETFVNEMLSRHLQTVGYERVSARLLGNSRLRVRRGGIRPWTSVKRDIVRHLKEDRHCLATTMVDYYGLPKSGDRAWPGREAATSLPVTEKALRVEDALFDDIVSEMGSGFNANRFVPYVVMHEFEGLLFSDCTAFARGIGRPEMQAAFQEIREQFATPEEIDDSPTTAPSKRVEGLIAGYDKPLLGTLAALAIGLSKISAACPHFRSWLSRLEQLGRSSL
jgi:uncharacterized protein DUF4276